MTLHSLSVTNGETSGQEQPGDSKTGAGILNDGTLTIVRSTISENTATIRYGLGGGLGFSLGGGVSNFGTLFLDRCTIAENSPAIGDGIANWGALEIAQSTVSGNVAGLGSDSVVIKNSVIHSIFSSDLSIRGTNIVSTLSGSDVEPGPAIIVADPHLAPLGDYGGPTPAMPPLPGSPAIDVHDDPVEATTDQRGFPRLVGFDYDLGAVEYQGNADFERLFAADFDQDGNGFGIEQALRTDPYSPDH